VAEEILTSVAWAWRATWLPAASRTPWSFTLGRPAAFAGSRGAATQRIVVEQFAEPATEHKILGPGEVSHALPRLRPAGGVVNRRERALDRRAEVSGCHEPMVGHGAATRVAAARADAVPARSRATNRNAAAAGAGVERLARAANHPIQIAMLEQLSSGGLRPGGRPACRA
jgi:hypothetical protein